MRVGLLNRTARTGRGLGLVVAFDRAQLPCLMQWQAFQSGLYALGIEPATNHARGRTLARQRGELIELGHNGSRDYTLSLEVLDGGPALERFAAEARAAAPEPPDDFAEPTGRWPDAFQ